MYNSMTIELDNSVPDAGAFRDFYDLHFYALFSTRPKCRIGLAKLAFEAGMAAQRGQK